MATRRHLIAQVAKFVAVLLGLIFVCAVSFNVGVLVGVRNEYRDQHEEQYEVIAPILASDAAYSDVKVSPDLDGGWVLLVGRVPSGGYKERLRGQLALAIGQRRADYAITGVTADKHE